MGQCVPFRCIFREFLAEQFKALFDNDSSEHFYMAFGRVTSWAQEPTAPGADDNNPPQNIDSVKSTIEAWSAAVGFKHIDFNDVWQVIPRVDWEPNVVFDQYEDNVDLFGPEDDEFKRFYVLVDGQNVYKCLGNNFGGLSTEKPTGVSTEAFVRPSDQYRWKFMYRVPEDLRDFLTEDYIPCQFIEAEGVLPDETQLQFNVQEAAIDGSIDYIDLISPGDTEPQPAYPFSIPPDSVHFVQRSEFADVNSGLIQSFPVVGEVELEGTADPNDDAYNNMVLRADDGAGTIEERVITDWNGTTKVATLDSAFTGAISVTDAYEVKSREMKGSSTLSEVNDLFNGYVVAIVAGPGIGQQREVIAYDGVNRVFTLAEPWEADLVADANPALSSFYQVTPKVTVTGDGEGCTASSVVDVDAVITSINVVTRGTGYTRAEVEVTPVFPLGQPAPAEANAVISPPGGHGSNALKEFCARRVLIRVRFNQDELEQFAVANDFRQFWMVKNPILNDGSGDIAGEEDPLELLLEVSKNINPLVSNSFTVGEFVIGDETGAVGEIIAWSADVSGNFGYLTIKNPTTDEFRLPDPPSLPAGELLSMYDQPFTTWTSDIATAAKVDQVPRITPPTYRQTYDVTLQSDGTIAGQLTDASFTLDRIAVGKNSGTEGIIVEWVPSVDGLTGVLKLVDVIGDYDIGEQMNEYDPDTDTTVTDIGEVTAISEPELLFRSGELTYIQNVKPIQRDIEQAEEFKILVEF